MCEEGEARARLKILKILARRRSGSVKFTWCFYRNRNGNGNGKLAPRAAQYEYGFSAAPHAHPQPAAALSSALSADRGPGGAKDFAAEPASSSVVHTSDDPGGGADDDDPGGGSTNSAEDVSAMVSDKVLEREMSTWRGFCDRSKNEFHVGSYPTALLVCRTVICMGADMLVCSGKPYAIPLEAGS